MRAKMEKRLAQKMNLSLRMRALLRIQICSFGRDLERLTCVMRPEPVQRLVIVRHVCHAGTRLARRVGCLLRLR